MSNTLTLLIPVAPTPQQKTLKQNSGELYCVWASIKDDNSTYIADEHLVKLVEIN